MDTKYVFGTIGIKILQSYSYMNPAILAELIEHHASVAIYWLIFIQILNSTYEMIPILFTRFLPEVIVVILSF